MPDLAVLALGLAVLAGATVQSTVGFGMAVVAAPAVVLVAPELMPAALLVPSAVLPVVHLARVERDVAWRPLGWALAARALLTPVGVVVVALFSPRLIAVLVAALILLTVASSVRTLEVRPTPRNAALAGAVSGVSGTAAAIGGPFLALVLQRERPERLRSTLAVFFVAGSALGLGGLAVGGQLESRQVLAGSAWVAFALAGQALAGPLRRRVDPTRFRRLVLGFCVVASLAVIVRAVLA